ncbi:hypothetical protein L3Q82_017205, partial [Scortum barcoo]
SGNSQMQMPPCGQRGRHRVKFKLLAKDKRKYDKTVLPKQQVVKDSTAGPECRCSGAEVLTKTRKRDHITPVLASLHWLPVKFRVDFKILLLLTYKALHGLAPSYLNVIDNSLSTD